MAGYRAFARVVSLQTDGVYVPDILGFEASNMFLEPERHAIRVYEVDEGTLRYLRELAYVFSHERRGMTKSWYALLTMHSLFGRRPCLLLHAVRTYCPVARVECCN